jgi:TrmH family RNA methyltransferase
MMLISSSENARIKAARKLQQKRHRLANRQILLEGVRLIADAFRSGFRPAPLFYLPELAGADAPTGQLLAQLQAAGVECLACSAAVFATLTETVNPQGVVAVVPLPALPAPRNPQLTLLLDQVREPGNAGTLLRAAEAAGADWVIAAPGTVDLFNEKVLRAGMGAHFRLPIVTCTDWTQVEQALPAGHPLYLAEARAELVYDQVDWRAPVVLAIGGEASGASVSVRSLATPIAIPMAGQTESLNAAIAGAVILFEAARQRRLVSGS